MARATPPPPPPAAPPATLRRSRWWHAALAAVVAASLVTELVLTLAAAEGPGTGTRLVRFASYFTVQSNLLVLAAALGLALRPDRDGRWWRVLRLDALLGITITGVVFGTVLAALVDPSGARWWTNAGLHYAAPAATLLGWLLFGPRPRVDRRSQVLAFAWPVAWIGWTFAHGALGGWYPYPFLDAGELGLPVALRNTAVVLLLGALLAVVLGVLDTRLRAVADHR
ncbi:Pr6Pr family membrane protein [Kineococcus glutinatus]|uniref:Pr6Pr family membrane protein n=1 Tax=Kineococcus glutinatus TaxID=1070872 RepID=A0ABP8VEP7_9ACTN